STIRIRTNSPAKSERLVRAVIRRVLRKMFVVRRSRLFLSASGSSFGLDPPRVQIDEITSVVFPPLNVERNLHLLAHLQILQLLRLFLQTFQLHVLRKFVLGRDDEFALRKPAR